MRGSRRGWISTKEDRPPAIKLVDPSCSLCKKSVEDELYLYCYRCHQVYCQTSLEYIKKRRATDHNCLLNYPQWH